MPHYTGHLAAASNRADLLFGIEILTPADEFVDLTGSTITVAMRLAGQYGAVPLLTGSTGDGHVVITGVGTADVHFTRAEMTQFGPGDLDIGVTVMLNTGITYQLFGGQIPIVDGVVAA